MTTPAERAERICVLAKASRTGLRGGTHQSCHECANVIREIEGACEEAVDDALRLIARTDAFQELFRR